MKIKIFGMKHGCLWYLFIFFILKDAAFINKIGVSSSLSTMYVCIQCKYKLIGLEF